MVICGDKSVSCIRLRKNRFVSIHSKITCLQLLKRWIRVSLCSLQKENKVDGDFAKRNSILLRDNSLLNIFHLKVLTLVVLLIFPGRKYFNFQSKFEYYYEVVTLFILEINIEYNSFEVNFSKLRNKLFLSKG